MCIRDSCKIVNAKNAPSSNARYLTLIGMTKNNKNSTFGYNAAKAKNSDRFKYEVPIGNEIPVRKYTISAAIK